MHIDQTTEELFKKVAKLDIVDSKNDSYKIKLYGTSEVDISYSHFAEVIENLKILDANNDKLELTSPSSYEIIVKEESSIPINSLLFKLRREKAPLILRDTTQNITYEISYLSNEFLLWITLFHPDRSNVRIILRSYPFIRAEDTINEYFEIAKKSTNLMTIKIKSAANVSVDKFREFLSSFLFHVGYNLDSAVIPQTNLDGIRIHRKMQKLNRMKLNELDIPRRYYIDDLVQHYMQAISSDNVILKYLSYYHIIEHFFEQVFSEELIHQIQTIITAPGFSYKHKGNIKSLIEIIKKKHKFQKDNILENESEALLQCLRKYINIDELKTIINNYDNTLLDYYANHEVGFAGGAKVNFNDSPDSVYVSLGKRIYPIRNSIVHSKASFSQNKKKFEPFRDDKELLSEIPLMRFIAEMIIIVESKPI